MVSTAEGRNSSDLVTSLREKIAEYKEFLLEQLIAHRTELLEAEDTDRNTTTGVTVTDMEVDDEQLKARIDRVVEKKKIRSASDDQSQSSELGRHDNRIPHVAVKNVISFSKKRSLMESSSCKRQVLRTSTPPKKYLDSSRHSSSDDHDISMQLHEKADVSTSSKEEEDDSEDLKEKYMTLEQTHSEFEKKLRSSLRLRDKLRSRSLTVTRKRQLPRFPAPPRLKTQWDYLLAEMKWMATDFIQERNWKRVTSFHLAKDVLAAKNAEKLLREKENKHLARDIALQVSTFWRSMERIAVRSKVRFEAGEGSTKSENGDNINAPSVDTDTNTTSESQKKQANEQEEEKKNRDEKNDLVTPEVAETTFIRLKYKKIEVASGSREETSLVEAQKKMDSIVEAAKKSRFIMKTTELSEEAEQEEQLVLQEISRGYRSLLAAFQVVALRWMWSLYTSGFNMLLNDQLGMGKACSIGAFLRLIEVREQKTYNTPHLLIVADEEVHKWAWFTRLFFPSRKIQIYRGSMSQRRCLQRDWRERKTVTEEVLEMLEEEIEDLEPLLCCICPVSLFVQDQQAFIEYDKWQMVIVENEYSSHFEELSCVTSLKKLKQKKRRILCNGQSLDEWKHSLQYAQFLLEMHDPPLAIVLDKETDEPKETVQEDLEVNSQKQWGNELWTKGRLVLDKSSAQQAMKFFGRGSTWKSQGEISALQLALHCLSVRRVRSEVEAQLGKVEEQSIACNLTSSQSSHYRNAIAGFAASLNGTETMDSWFCFLLRLRSICNCVDLLNDLEKLSHADLRLLQSSSTKLDALLGQLTRFVSKEHKRVAIYCQLDSMFPVLEMFLGLLEITFVRVTGSKEIQQKALTHFALRGNVRVALASTRLSASSRAVTIYGADVIFVLDSDWNSVCDAKLRASWAKAAAVGRKDETQPLHIFRFHCENTIESSLMRVGACVLNEKVLSEVTPQELISVPEDLAAGMIFPISFEKPAWWKNVSGTSKDVTGDNIALEMSKAERSEKFCDEIETPILPSWEIDAEEHLLLSNTDELMPVEWYAVNFVHSVTDKRYVASTGGLEHEEHIHNDVSRNISFEEVSAVEVKNLWQSEEVSHMFYPETPLEGAEDSVLYKLMEAFRANNGMEPDYGLYQPPQPPLHKEFAEADPEMVPLYSHMQFRVAYRVPVPPPVKAKADSTGTEDAIKLSKLKKQKSTSGATGRPSSSTTAGLKRKLSEQQAPKEHRERVDFEGIPLPDVGSFEDDDFWGDTNLDALDSVSWDDASVLTGILGPSLDSVGTQRVGQTKKHKTSTVKTKKVSSALDSVKDTWTNSDDVLLKKLFEIYGANWTIISHVLNGSYSSRFFCKKRTPRQCYDRYGKVTSSGISTEKSDLLEICLVGRVGLPEKDSFLKYSERDSLPGLPPPSIANVPQVEDLALKNMCYAPPSALDGRPSNVAMLDLIPIKKSFEAIIQCMKRKSSTSTLPVASGSSDVSKSNVETPSTEVLIPPPHKSHTDMISLLPNVILSPNEVIKRGKEATVAAVQAAAVQAAGVSRDVSPLAATGDVILGAAFGSHAARKAQAAVGSNRITPISSGQPRTPTWGMDVASRRNSVGSTATTPTNAANVSTAQIATVTTPNSALGTPNAVAANPVTTSTLLYVIDRMPEIKNKIQVILNRSDVSESQKVAMIARLLNNSNAMSATASVTASTAAAAAATGASVGSLSPYPLDVIPSASASSLGTTPSTTPIPASSPLSGNSRPSSTSASPSSRPPKPSSSTPGST